MMQALPWEHQLLSWAHEGLADRRSAGHVVSDPQQLRHAYRYCAELTAGHSRTFHLASGLLPPEKRQAVRALYAFCRRADDFVDRPAGDAQALLAGWRIASLAAHPDPEDPVALAWSDTRRRYRIPGSYVEQFLDGVARDLAPTRYATFANLAQYAYGVASTVGLMVAHIIGFAGPQAIPYAVRLGVALQVTNILRDVGEDWRNGRLYLPLAELAAYGLDESDVGAGRVDDRWRAFMAFQVARNHALYEQAMPGIAMLDGDGRKAIAAAAVLYRGILDDIKAHDADVFSRRAHVGIFGRLRRVPAVWLAVRGGRSVSLRTEEVACG
jgi:phytoene synthase